MDLKLNVYTDESMTEIKRVCEADKLKIPYRVSMYLISTLDELNLDNDDDLIKFISTNTDKLDKIVKATFGVSETELECVDGGELITVIKELYQWGIAKIDSLKKDKDEKNVMTPANQ